MISFRDRIKMFDPKYQQNKDTTKKQNIPSKLKSNLFNQDYMVSNKLLPKSKLISEKNGLFIYRYPLINFSDTDNISVKNILLLGNNQKPFINNFINYISNVLYDDKFRYESQSLNDDNFKPFSIYNIKADTISQDFLNPFFKKTENFGKVGKLGINIMYSAFIVGYIIKMIYGDKKDIKTNISYLENFVFSFFVPIYFALVGIQLNVIHDFSIIRFILFFIVAFGLEFIGTYLLLLFSNLKKNIRMSFAITMNARGGPGIVLATVAYASNIISLEFFTVLILTTMLSSMIAGYYLRGEQKKNPKVFNELTER